MTRESGPLSDLVTPFLIDHAHVRGRVVRLIDVAQTILSRYDYPTPVAMHLGELLVAAAMLSANLKQDGIFTIQIKGKGLVPLMVVDAVYGGALRGYAQVSEDAAAKITQGQLHRIQDIFGEEAYLAITLDPGKDMHRYQGVVALEGNRLMEAIQHYFTQSQQIEVAFEVAIERVALPGTTAPRWMASGVMIERLPETAPAPDADGWRYARAMLATLKAGELLDPLLDAPAVLFRLFHEEGVVVYDAQPLSVGCRCSRERIVSLLSSMPLEERADMVASGTANVHCQFCNKSETFTAADLGVVVN